MGKAQVLCQIPVEKMPGIGGPTSKDMETLQVPTPQMQVAVDTLDSYCERDLR